MLVYLKNVNTGHKFGFDSEIEAGLIKKKLELGNYELLDQEKIEKTELEKLDIPEIPKILPMKKRLLTKKKG